MKDLKRFLSYMGKNSFTYWFILIATLIIESFLQILYSYVTKRIINAIEFQNIEAVSHSSDCKCNHCNIKVSFSISKVFSNKAGS